MRSPRPRWRFRLRTLMVIVALVAVALALTIEARRLSHLSGLYRQKVEHFARIEGKIRGIASFWEESAAEYRVSAKQLREHRLPDDLSVLDLKDEERESLESLRESGRDWPAQPSRSDDVFRTYAERCDSKARECVENVNDLINQCRHYAALVRKYNRAASHPWLPDPPDPPDPPEPE